MTYRVEKARIELTCDQCGVARNQFDSGTIGGCIREAREAGWILRNTGNALTNEIEKMKRLSCYCPGCLSLKDR